VKDGITHIKMLGGFVGGFVPKPIGSALGSSRVERATRRGVSVSSGERRLLRETACHGFATRRRSRPALSNASTPTLCTVIDESLTAAALEQAWGDAVRAAELPSD